MADPVEMPEYTFRLAGRLPDEIRLNVPDPVFDLSGPYHKNLSLRSIGGGTSIYDSEFLVLQGDGHETEEEATETGLIFRDYLTLALAGVGIAADFGDRAPRSGFTKAGLELFRADDGEPIRENALGLTVFETSLNPSFATISGKSVIGQSPVEFEDLFRRVAEEGTTLVERDRLAYDLFSSSFFEPSADGRLMLLMTAVEVIIELNPRPPSSVKHAEHLIDLTKKNMALEISERDSILGVLGWLSSESIGQAGRRMSNQRLVDKLYNGKKPESFFSEAYELRSRLVHGKDPFPTRAEVVSILPTLEGFVADLICLPHLASAI